MPFLRRNFLTTAAAAPAFLRAKAEQRPHIVFLFADDLGRYSGAYRDRARPSLNDIVRTPSFDRLASEGVRFTNAFMATPSCTPSRAAVATGCYSFRCGSAANLKGGDWRNHPNPAQQLPGFGTLLQQSGYHIHSQFKTLQANWLGNKDRGNLGAFHRYSTYLSDAPSASEAKARRQQVYQQSRDSLRQAITQRGAGQPFFHVYGPINTHRPWVRGSGKKLWDIDPDSLKGKLPAFLPDVPAVREDMADYLGEVQGVDWILKAILDELDEFADKSNTMLVLAGDNGMPGVPRGKCNLYDHGTHAPLLIRWPERIQPNTVRQEFTNLMDLAPTFLEAARLTPPVTMNGRSLAPLFGSQTPDLTRDAVITTRERHFPTARPGSLPYPSRAIRTKEFLYIRNFKPDRWPMGEPGAGAYNPTTDADELTYFKDMDFSPTKAWILAHKDGAAARHYQLGFALRPAEELYDLRRDPDQVQNIAPQKQYAAAKETLANRLMKVLGDAKDPRLTDAFDKPPYVEAEAAQ